MIPAAASAAQGSASSRATNRPKPRKSGSTNSAGTLKFLKLQTGSDDTDRAETPIMTGPQNNGWCATTARFSRPNDLASNPRNNGNSASPAPQGAGTPVKKLLVYAGRCVSSDIALKRARRSAMQTANRTQGA